MAYYDSPFVGKEFHRFQQKRSFYSYRVYSSSTDQEDFQKQDIALCEQLKVNSKLEFTKLVPQSFIKASSTATRTDPWPQVVDSCIACHDSPHRVGPYIPFRHPETLLTHLRHYRSQLGWGDAIDTIEFYVSPSAIGAHLNGDRMPLGRRPLSPEETQLLLNWLKKSKDK
ncbi:MAG: hypothetical protein KDD61_16395 [Bdellovibrionales bacterium]|nr:hypothetical protein [Bdellovibrionales bacterium]